MQSDKNNLVSEYVFKKVALLRNGKFFERQICVTLYAEREAVVRKVYGKVNKFLLVCSVQSVS